MKCAFYAVVSILMLAGSAMLIYQVLLLGPEHSGWIMGGIVLDFIALMICMSMAEVI